MVWAAWAWPPPLPPTLRWGSPVSGAPSCACRGPGAPHCPCARALFLPVLGSPMGALCLPPGGRGQGHGGRSRTRRGGQQPGRRSWPVDAPLQTGAGAQVRAGLGRLAAGRGAVCRAPRTEWRLEPRAHLVRGGEYTQGAQHWSGQRVPRPPGFVSLGLLGVWRVFLKKDTRVPHPVTEGASLSPQEEGSQTGAPRFSESSWPKQLSDCDKDTFCGLCYGPVGPSGRDLEVRLLPGVGGPWLPQVLEPGALPPWGWGTGRGGGPSREMKATGPFESWGPGLGAACRIPAH